MPVIHFKKIKMHTQRPTHCTPNPNPSLPLLSPHPPDTPNKEEQTKCVPKTPFKFFFFWGGGGGRGGWGAGRQRSFRLYGQHTFRLYVIFTPKLGLTGPVLSSAVAQLHSLSIFRLNKRHSICNALFPTQTIKHWNNLRHSILLSLHQLTRSRAGFSSFSWPSYPLSSSSGLCRSRDWMTLQVL